jgi:hypothetical protein
MTFYINFDSDSGQIFKFTNEVDKSSLYIETDKETYIDFVNGKKNVDDYLILPTSSKDQVYELVSKHRGLLNFDVDKSVHQLQKVVKVNFKNGFVVQQNIVRQNWTVYFTDSLKQFLNNTTYYKDKTMYLYVTTNNNPNILLDTLIVPLRKLLNGSKTFVIENTNKDIAKNKNVSIYCGKVFDNYAHIQEEK